MIKAEKLGFSYSPNGPSILKDINLEIAEHGIIAIIGPNGSGKSTLAKLLNGLYLPDAGRVVVDGIDSHLPQYRPLRRQKVKLLFPEAEKQFISGTVEEDVAVGSENLNLPANEIRVRVDNALKLLSMEDLAKYPPYLLSAGQKQKVG